MLVSNQEARTKRSSNIQYQYTSFDNDKRNPCLTQAGIDETGIS
jgi:hypothetical protein